MVYSKTSIPYFEQKKKDVAEHLCFLLLKDNFFSFIENFMVVGCCATEIDLRRTAPPLFSPSCRSRWCHTDHSGTAAADNRQAHCTQSDSS